MRPRLYISKPHVHGMNNSILFKDEEAVGNFIAHHSVEQWSTYQSRPESPEECLKFYPRIVAHMICQSLGYFSPLKAAGALSAYILGDPFSCEWYDSMVQGKIRRIGVWDDGSERPERLKERIAHSERWIGKVRRTEYNLELLLVNRMVVRGAFELRRTHQGYMTDFERAADLVKRERDGVNGPMLASWF